MPRSDRLTAWTLAEGPSVGFALFRIVTGLMAIRHLIGYARDWSKTGFYGDFFFYPYASWIPQPNEPVYLAVIFLGILSAAFVIVGYQTRVASITCFLMVAYHLSLNQIWYRHNRYFLVLALLLLCLAPAHTALSIDATRLKLPPIGPLWSGFLIKAQMTLIYLGSAISKTLDEGWRSGAVLTGRSLDRMWEQWMPGFVVNVIPPDAGARLLTIQALISEFFLAFFVWFPRTRRFAIWWGIIFHGFIEVRYSVLTFTYLTLATYFIFAELRSGEKQWLYSSQSPLHRLLARVVPLLDWMFQVRVATHSGRGHRFIARDGTVYRGLTAWIMLGANLPITFTFFYPLSWVRYLRWGKSSETLESAPVQSPKFSVHWLVGCLALYLVFLGIINLHAPARPQPEMRRFIDLPWFFALMCLMAGAYHRTMIWSSSTRRVEVREGALPEEAPAGALRATS